MPEEYPKFVLPHPSHVVRAEGRTAVTPLFSEHHEDRNTGEVTVLVGDESGEKLALSPRPEIAADADAKPEPEPEPAPVSDPAPADPDPVAALKAQLAALQGAAEKDA